jgi:hypothetical protein
MRNYTIALIKYHNTHLLLSSRPYCQSDFATLSPEPLQEQPRCGSLLEGVLVSLSLAMDECSDHGDLRGSGHWSIIPYVHERTELYCAQACPTWAYLFVRPKKWRLPKSFIAQGWTVTMSLEARQVVPMWLKPYTTARVLMTRSNK